MADHNKLCQIAPSSSPNTSKDAISDIEAPHRNLEDDHLQHENNVVDYTQRAQWLRAAVLGANDGLLSTASLMMGVGAVRKDVKTMILTGVAGLFAGACSMAIGEFVSVYSQYDIEVAQLKREGKEVNKAKLPNPFYAAAASAVAFAVGAVVPLLGAAFVKEYRVRLVVVAGVVSLALLGFGVLSAVLGKAPVGKSSCRVLIGGWLAMGITFGLTKSVDSIGV
ncbi:vacuolar iron transporter homolog 4-like [Neltuma alba]|uniref:vacuolar iron transporter homolog 4-like n=1 Tax=Neltuma alba TaxID=207710 RepID=UPI0010A443A2|nr:vacuolar iron transporter homolog 4-like [Prosopis alba]